MAVRLAFVELRFGCSLEVRLVVFGSSWAHARVRAFGSKSGADFVNQRFKTKRALELRAKEIRR